MRVIVTKEVTRTVVESVTEDVLCNKCGKSCKTPIGNYEGLIEARVEGGYDSPVIGDCVSWTFSVCEHCLAEFVATFKIPAAGEDFFGGPFEVATRAEGT